MSESSVQAGVVVAGKYRVEHLLGEGGMGAVYQARHIELDQLVAIKVLLKSVASDMARRRFRREARAAARMRGEHVCRVLDVGELPDGSPYMVMEYLEGRDLGDELADRGSLPAAEAVGFALQACEALAEAHAAGVVHRDLKPGNLFLYERVGGRTVVKVLDFGVSKVLDGASTPGGEMSLTSTSMLVGSPLYMSPEQLESSRDVDGRTDIWSLGVVLHEMLSGDPPFMADTMPQLVRAVLSGDPPSLARLELPEGLEAVVLRALSKDRDDRYSTVGELADALLPFADSMDRSSAGRVQRFLSSPPIVTAEGEAADTASSRAESRAAPTPNGWERSVAEDAPVRRRGAWLWITAAAVIVAGGATAWLMRAEPPVADNPADNPATAATATGTDPSAAVVPAESGRSARDPLGTPPVPPKTGVGAVTPPASGGTARADQADQAEQAADERADEPAEVEAAAEPVVDPPATPDADKLPASAPVAGAVKKPRRAKPTVRRRPKPAKAPAPAVAAPPSPTPTKTPAADGLPDFGGRR